MRIRLFLLAAAFSCLAAILWQQRISLLAAEERLAEQNRYIGEISAANTGLAQALEEMERENRLAGALLVNHSQRNDQLENTARRLENRLRESFAHATVNIDTTLPGTTAVALCLRYHAAAGNGQAYPPSAAGIPDAGEDDPLTACGNWRGLTYRQSLEWLGLLLDHAGRERLDKRALRDWASSMTADDRAFTGPAQENK